MGVLDFEKPERKTEFFERGPEIAWVFGKGDGIRMAYFVYDAAYVLLGDQNEVFLLRIGEREVPPEKIVSVKDGSDFFYSEKTGKLYYLESLQGGLVSVDILPEGVTLAGVFNDLEKETREGRE